MQGELFTVKTASSMGDSTRLSTAQPNWLDRFRFTLRLDHMAVAAISALVLYVLVFSFGVEKGKRIAVKEIRAERIKQRHVAQELLQSQASAAAPSLVTPAVAETPGPTVSTPAEPVRVFTPKYTIQLITFTSRTRAEEEVKKLKEKGFQGFIIPGGKFFQVCVDGFEKMNDAKAKLLQLKQDGFAPRDAYIRPLTGQIPL